MMSPSLNMSYLINFTVILGTILQSTVVSSQLQKYRAAIAVYKPEYAIGTPDEDVTANINNFVKYIGQVKDKADILIFPEYGLTKIDFMWKSPTHLKYYSVVVKDVGYQYNNCSLEDNLAKIACAAKANGVYVVLNLLEEQEAATFYVTNIAIDSTGTIAMKCRKQHLINGTSFKQAPNENSCSFTAKFKSLSTSFAVLYETDMVYGIPESLKKDNIIMTSAIKNTMPFEFGPSLHAAFAINNNVNLLVAAYSDKELIKNGFGGSGIYLKNGTSVFALDASPADNILIKEIPLITDSSTTKRLSAVMKGVAPAWNLPYLKASYVRNSNKTVRECSEDEQFCCEFRAELAQDTIEPYKWVFVHNKSSILDQQVDVFVCALTKPAASSKTLSFQTVAVTSTVKNRVTIQSLPIGVASDFSLPDFEYDVGGTLKLLRQNEIISFGLIRVMGAESGGPASTGVIIGVVVGVLVVLGLVGGGFWWYKRNGGYMRPGK